MSQFDTANGETMADKVSIKLVSVLQDGGPGIVIFDFGAYGGGRMTFIDP